MVGFIKGTPGVGRVHQGEVGWVVGFIKGTPGGRVHQGDAHRRQKDLELHTRTHASKTILIYVYL